MRQRRITPEAEKIYRKYNTAPLMHLKDDRTGEVLYTDRDVSDLAKWNVARGGPAANENLPDWHDINKFVEENFQEPYKCGHCGIEQPMFLQSIYVGQVFTDGSKGIRCSRCWQDSPVKEIPAILKNAFEFKFPWIEKYLATNVNSLEERTKVIKEYEEARSKR